ncbi:hypothetical protein BGZ74_002910 [Mortierella antarctica]|nr:hypothetical protein BGZ74_002910 [Mortierella antarctica]
MAFRQRSEDDFWEERMANVADRLLLANNATSAKKAGVAIQEAGLREVITGVKRYPTGLPNDESLEMTEDPESESESDPNAGSSVIVGQKHPRDPCVELDRESSKTPRNAPPSLIEPRKRSYPATVSVSRSDMFDIRRNAPPAPQSPFDLSPLDDTTLNNDDGAVLKTQVNPLGDSILDYGSPRGGYPQLQLGADLPSSDPLDPNFLDQDVVSTTKLYSWNFLEGSGRRDSNIDDGWIFNNAELGRDLMQFRERVIQENGGFTQPHEKLAVNFVFLVEADHQIRGLQAEVEDESWEALCEATRDQMDTLPDATIVEAHRWVHSLANEKPESFRAHLNELPPKDPTLKSVLNKLASNGQLWNDQLCNKDIYLESCLGPFLDTYLGNIGFTMSAWTQTQDDTRDSDSDLPVPNFTMMTVASKRQLSVVLLEGKVHSNRTFQIWDNKTMLGQGLKLAWTRS